MLVHHAFHPHNLNGNLKWRLIVSGTLIQVMDYCIGHKGSFRDVEHNNEYLLR